MGAPGVVVFDLGGVVIDWDPRHLYRKLFPDPSQMERFLSEVCTPEWNEGFDRGLPFQEGVERLAAERPEWAEPIRAYRDRWPEMLAGTIPGAPELLRELREEGVRLFALSNWSTETFRFAVDRFGILDLFEGILLSGQVGATKPSIRLFQAFLERFGLDPQGCVFVDDRPDNVQAARALGFRALTFRSAGGLRSDLVDLGLLGPGAEPDRR
ncbi:MAG TPA: HAD family phosphatase [Actinomycetota bacterium]|jgi:2-haloacid dehalogenase|nr:HAD family phosphatase [Actinomycetota bacterium]